MKRTAALTLALAAALTLEAAQVVNRTLATVNGEPILQSEFDKTYAALTADMPDDVPVEAQRENKRKLLDNLIDQKLVLQEAKKRKLRVTQRDLEMGLVQIRARFLPPRGQQDLQRIVERQMEGKSSDAQAEGPDLAAAWATLEKDNPAAVKEAMGLYQEELRKEGLDAKKMEERIKDQLLANQLTQMEVRSRVKPPTEAEVKALYDKILQAMQGKSVADAGGIDMAELAQHFAAQTGEKIRARHVLVKVARGADAKQKAAALKKAQGIKKRLDAGEDFGEVAQKESDDKGSAQRGGDLGVVVRGQTVPAFEKAAFALPLGKVSEPVETDFGYHVILVEEKKAASKLRYDDAKEDIAELLMNVQGRDALMAFVKDLRKNASIKLLVDKIDELGAK